MTARFDASAKAKPRAPKCARADDSLQLLGSRKTLRTRRSGPNVKLADQRSYGLNVPEKICQARAVLATSDRIMYARSPYR